MAGIASYGAYVPLYRLSRDELARAWSKKSSGGEKAVANVDEDSITLAVEAAVDCLRGIDRESIDGLYFATTTPPYREKQSASLIAATLDLRRDAFTADFGHSLRGATSALHAAIDAVKAKSAKRVLVVAADIRLGAPGSEHESLFGDAAAAVLVSAGQTPVSIDDSASTYSEFLDVWRTESDAHTRSWEDRFVVTHGYQEVLGGAVQSFLKKTGAGAKDFAKAVLYGPEARSHQILARSVGFDPKTQVQDPLFASIGHAGAAQVLVTLAAALGEAKSGDRILVGGYGDGADLFALTVKAGLDKVQKGRRGVKGYLASKMTLRSYERYLRFRNLLAEEAILVPPERSSLTMTWRDRRQIYALRGHKCRKCGTIQYPQQRVCTWCQAKDEFDEVRLSEKRGTLFTYSIDDLVAAMDKPQIMCVMDFSDGGRFYSAMTDRDPAAMAVGMPLELTLRKIHDSQGVHNYFWKIRPTRGE